VKLSEAQAGHLRAEFAAHMEHIRSLSAQVPQEQREGFQNALLQSLDGLQDQIGSADQLTNDYLTGRTDDINSVVLAVEKADLALTFALRLRSKALDAYQSIMQMPV
jgi:flagellar hook-basal body complex protein FliE